MVETRIPIGLGARAEVYAWRPGQAVKLFPESAEPGEIAREARLGLLAEASGLPVPRVSGLVEFEGRPGIVMERLPGRTMHEILRDQPWRSGRLAVILAGLHATIHARTIQEPQAAELPDQRDVLRLRLLAAPGLPDQVREAVLEALAALPDGDRLCHGDFLPANVMLSPGGPAAIIDWPDACRGDPLADVARTVAGLRVYHSGSRGRLRPVLVWMAARLFETSYLATYRRLRPFARRELAAWLPLAAAARLTLKMDHERSTLLRLAAGRRGPAGASAFSRR